MQKKSVIPHTALDGAGVAGHGLNIASDFVPNEYGQGICFSLISGCTWQVILWRVTVLILMSKLMSPKISTIFQLQWP